MSLINDALKRAEAAQGKAEPSGGPDLKFRPVDPKKPTQKGFGWVWPWVITAAAVTAVFLIWQLNHRGKELEPKEKQIPATAAAGEPAKAAGQTRTFLPGSTMKVHAREQDVDGASAVAAMPGKGPGTATTEKVAVVALSGTTLVETTQPGKKEGTNSTAVSEAGPVRPAGPKLQAIVFNPANPSAIINGESVFVGEKVGVFRVLKIGQESVTLAGGGETNVLKLGQ